MKDTLISNIESNLKSIIDDNTIFDNNLSNDYKYKRIISNLTIDNNLSKEDINEVNNTLKSIKKFIEFVSLYQNELINIQNNIEKYAEKEIDFFKTDLYFSITNSLEEKLLEKLGYDSIEDFESQFNDEYFYWIEDNKYLAKVSNDIRKKEINKLFNYLNNDVNFKSMIESVNTDEEKDIFNKKINNLLGGRNYKVLDNISFDTAMLAYDKGLHTIFQYTKDEYIEKLKLNQIHLVFFDTDLGNKNIESKLKLVSKKISFKDFYSYMDFNVSNTRNLYEIYDYIDKDSLDFIISNNLYNGIEKNNYILTNKEYLKRILTNRTVYNEGIIFKIPASVMDDELYNFIFGKDNVGNFFKYRDTPCKFLESYDLALKVAQDINVGHENFLKSIPKGYLKKEFVIFCMLNGMGRPDDPKIAKLYPKNTLRSRNLDDIKFAIDKGYKCSNKTLLFDADEMNLFIESGQPEIIDYYNVPSDLIIKAIEKGYIFNDEAKRFELLVDNEKYKIISYCIENDKKDYLLGVYRNYRNEFILLTKEYVKNNPNYESVEQIFTEHNLMDDIIDITVFKYNAYSFGDEDWTEIISKRYNIDALNYYIEGVNNKIIFFDINKDNINTYFDDKGPTREFYDIYLYDNEYNFEYILEYLYSGKYKEIYKDEPEILGFINFKFKIGKLVGKQIDYKFLRGNIDKYFDINGPKKELYDVALFNKWFFVFIYSNLTNVDFNKMYSNQKNVIQFINFMVECDTSVRIDIKSFEDIDKYFDEEGPKKEF